jgi:hypothetical protein
MNLMKYLKVCFKLLRFWFNICFRNCLAILFLLIISAALFPVVFLIDLHPHVVQTVATCGIGLGYACVIVLMFQKRLWRQIKSTLGIKTELPKGSAVVHAESGQSTPSGIQNCTSNNAPNASSGDVSSSSYSSEQENRNAFSSAGSYTADVSASTITRGDMSSGSRSQSSSKYKTIEPIKEEEPSVNKPYVDGVSKFEPPDSIMVYDGASVIV